MRNNRISETLLREYVRSIILEYGAIESTGLPDWGLSDNDLINAFITPFTDVVETAVGKSKEIIRKGQTLVRSSYEAVISSFLPAVQAEYGEIFDKEKSDIQKIRSEYKNVYDRTEAAMGKAKTLAFFVAPQLLLPDVAKGIAKGTAETSAGLLNVASGGYFEQLIGSIKGNKSLQNLFGRSDGGGPSSFFERRLINGRILSESEDELEEKLNSILEDPQKRQKLMKAIEKNIAPIRQKIIAAKEEKLNNALELAQNFINAKNIDQMKKSIKGKVGSDFSKAEKELENIASPEEIKKIVGKLPESTKNFAKNLIVAPLEKELKELKNSGLEGDLIKKYSDVIQKINSL